MGAIALGTDEVSTRPWGDVDVSVGVSSTPARRFEQAASAIDEASSNHEAFKRGPRTGGGSHVASPGASACLYR